MAKGLSGKGQPYCTWRSDIWPRPVTVAEVKLYRTCSRTLQRSKVSDLSSASSSSPLLAIQAYVETLLQRETSTHLVWYFRVRRGLGSPAPGRQPATLLQRHSSRLFP